MHITTELVFYSLVSLVQNSAVLVFCLLFSVSCILTVHEHCHWILSTPIRTFSAEFFSAENQKRKNGQSCIRTDHF